MKIKYLICFLCLNFCSKDDGTKTVRGGPESNNAAAEKVPSKPDAVPSSVPGAASQQTGDQNKVVVDTSGTITGIIINNGEIQRSRVRSITVNFNAKLNLDESAFALTLLSTPSQPIGKIKVKLSEVESKTIANLTFDGANTNYGSLNEGLWKLTVKADKVNAAGGKMVTNSEVITYCLYGDTTGEKAITGKSLAELISTKEASTDMANYLSYLDYNQAGIISTTSMQAFQSRIFDVQLRPDFLNINGGSAQRSKIKSLIITFPWKLDDSIKKGFQLTDANGAVLNITVSLVNLTSGDPKNSSQGNSTQVTINFAPAYMEYSSIKDGTYTLTFDVSVLQINGLTLKSGKMTQTFKRLFGDRDGDGKVTQEEYLAILNMSSKCPVTEACNAYDLNDDGIINSVDVTAAIARSR